MIVNLLWTKILISYLQNVWLVCLFFLAQTKSVVMRIYGASMVYHMIGLDGGSMEQTLTTTTVWMLRTFFCGKQHVEYSILIEVTLRARTDSVWIAEDWSSVSWGVIESVVWDFKFSFLGQIAFTPLSS